LNKIDEKSQLNALIIYFSATGNTQKVANVIWETLQEEKVKVNLLKVQDAPEEELYDYNLVFLGTPSYSFLPAKPIMDFINNKMELHMKRGDIKLCAPKIPGKNAVVFCTYSGPHTGINEAIPVGKYMGQFFEHIGFEIAAEWYVVGEFHGREENSTIGRLGNIKGRPNQQDLATVRRDVRDLIMSITSRIGLK
jgi:flavodoxin